MPKGRHTKEKRHRSPCPPSKEDEERHPEQCELNAKVNSPSLRQGLRWSWLFEEMAQQMSEEVNHSYGPIGRIGNEWQENEAKPFDLEVGVFAGKVERVHKLLR